MAYSLSTVTAATGLAVSIADVKAHLRVDHAHEDQKIIALIHAATKWIEGAAGLQLLNATLRYATDCWPCTGIILLPRYPVSSVSAVKYYNTSGTLTTLSASTYQVDTYSAPARVCPAVNYEWPDLQADRLNGVQVEFVAGYGAGPDNVDPTVSLAVRMLVAHLYENPDFNVEGPVKDVLPAQVMRLLDGVARAEITV